MKTQLLHLAAEVGGPLLGLDTSAQTASLVLVNSERREVVAQTLNAASRPSEVVVPGIASLLAQQHLTADALKALVIGLGPGSFTGLRVGLATLKGIALGAGVPLYGISSMEVLACQGGPGPAVVVGDARRGDLYAALFDGQAGGLPKRLLAEQVTNLAALTRAVTHALGEDAAALASISVLGDARQQVAEAWGARAVDAPLDMGHGILVAADRIRAGLCDDLAQLLPLYLRTSSVGR